MKTIILGIIKFFIKYYAKESIEYAVKYIVKSTDNKIDDELLNTFLLESSKSKGNKLTVNMVDEFMNILTSPKKEINILNTDNKVL
jgi:hypothetical protein